MEPMMEPKDLQNFLQEAGIQVDTKNIENPSEEFFINVILEYLRKLHFDGNEISKVTEEQMECLSFPESISDTIKIINLYSALYSICNEIFVKNLSLNDIVSPGPKKTSKIIKMLINFFIYMKTKIAENEVHFKNMDCQQDEIERMIDEKNAILAKIGATINERESKQVYKTKLRQNSQEINVIIKNGYEVSKRQDEKLKEIIILHQEASKNHIELQTKARKLKQITSDLELKIVKSPEEYAIMTKELQKILEIKKEERVNLNESITRKKAQIKTNEEAQNLIQNLSLEFSDKTLSTLKNLKQTSQDVDQIKKKINVLKIDIGKCNDNCVIPPHNYSLENFQQLIHNLDNELSSKKREFQKQNKYLTDFTEGINKKKLVLESYQRDTHELRKVLDEIMIKYQSCIKNELSKENALILSINNIQEKMNHQSGQENHK